MHHPIAGRSSRLALSSLFPLWLLAASTGCFLPTRAAVFGDEAAGVRSPASAALDSGIRGRVVLGPLRPSSRVDERSREQPLQTTLDIVKAEDGSRVAQIQTRPNGRFMVALPPGDYIVRSAFSDEIRRPSIEPVQVTVPAHAYVVVTINADTGIR